jgi:hypothetical protein
LISRSSVCFSLFSSPPAQPHTFYPQSMKIALLAGFFLDCFFQYVLYIYSMYQYLEHDRTLVSTEFRSLFLFFSETLPHPPSKYFIPHFPHIFCLSLSPPPEPEVLNLLLCNIWI